MKYKVYIVTLATAQGPDLQIKASKKCPGPGTYETHLDPTKKIRGGNFYQETRTTVLPKVASYGRSFHV